LYQKRRKEQDSVFSNPQLSHERAQIKNSSEIREGKEGGARGDHSGGGGVFYHI